MRRRQHVKKTAARIRYEENPLVRKLSPGDELPRDKQNSQARRYAPPAFESGPFAFTQVTPRYLYRKTAGQKNQRIHPENARKGERHPIISQPFAHQKRAGQRHKKHNDSGERQLNNGEISPLRRAVGFAAGAVSVVIATGGNIRPAAATGVDYLDLIC